MQNPIHSRRLSSRVRGVVIAAGLCLAMLTSSARGLTFDIEFSPGVASLPAPVASGIMANVGAAAGLYSATFFDDATIKVLVAMDSEEGEILGSSPFVFGAALIKYEEHIYTDVATALSGDALSPADTDSLSLLQTGPFIEAITHDTSLTPGDLGPGVPSPEIRLGSLAVGTTGAKAEATWNSVLRVARANSKALGLPVTVDGMHDFTFVIQDEALPGFDFDRGDGIAPGTFDFEAIAKHEFGHGLGFKSGVDDVDYAGVDPAGPAPDNPHDFSDEAIFTTLDLFRTNTDTRAPGIALGQPVGGGFVLDWRFGPPPGPFSKPFFSLDSTLVDPLDKTPYATGSELGDGFQASHWADFPIGLMVPDLDPGIILDISPTDIDAFDVIGYDTVPEPASAALLLLGGLVVARRRR